MEAVDKECGALGGLFQAIINDMKVRKGGPHNHGDRAGGAGPPPSLGALSSPGGGGGAGLASLCKFQEAGLLQSISPLHYQRVTRDGTRCPPHLAGIMRHPASLLLLQSTPSYILDVPLSSGK